MTGDELLDHLATGGSPDPNDPLAVRLAALRDEAREGDHIPSEELLARLRKEDH